MRAVLPTFRALAAYLLLAAGFVRATAPGSAAEDPRTRKTLIPDEPVRSVIPKREDDKRPNIPDKHESLLNPDSPLNGVMDLPWAAPPRPGNLPRFNFSREQREELDRRKNWIFVRPDDKSFSAEKMLGVKDQKDYLRSKDDDKEIKGVMQKFLEGGEAKKNGEQGDEGSSTNASQAATAKAERADPMSGAADRDRAAGTSRDPISGRAVESRSTSSLFEPGSASALFRPPGEFSSGSSLYADGAGGLGLPPLGAGMEKTPAQKAWANEFKQLLNSGGAALNSSANNPFGRSSDPVNFFNDATRQPVNPITGNLPGSLTSQGLSRSPFEPSRPNAFESPTRPMGLTEAAPQIFGGSSLSPALIAPPTPPANNNFRPGMLEPPRRKF